MQRPHRRPAPLCPPTSGGCAASLGTPTRGPPGWVASPQIQPPCSGGRNPKVVTVCEHRRIRSGPLGMCEIGSTTAPPVAG